jgi:hypothetical protein
MRQHRRIALAALLLALGACAQAPTPTRGPDQSYLVGETAFHFAEGAVLQTWPLMPRQEPLRYARIALQMPADSLDPALSAGRPIQIDVLAPQQSPPPMGVMAATFTDWAGRETAALGSEYHYDPRSPLRPDGGRRMYRRDAGPAGLIALKPAGDFIGTPLFFLHLNRNIVDRVIECRPDVPPSKNVGTYCGLRPEAGTDYGYRIFFPAELLPRWADIEAATKAYLTAARR